MKTNKINVWGMCLLFAVSLFLYTTAQAQEEKSYDYDEVMDKLESLIPSKAIEVRMGTEKEEYEVGDPFEMRFEASQDSYVTLMYISADKKIMFFAPSFKVPTNKVEGERVYSTLYDFDLKITVDDKGPYGPETINIFCTPEKFDLFKADFDKDHPVYTIESEDKARLTKLFESLEQLEEIEWSGNSVSFVIKDPKAPKGQARGQFSKRGGLIPPIGSTGTTGKFFPPIGSTGTTGRSEDAPDNKTKQP